jgi:hypothetical protein
MKTVKLVRENLGHLGLNKDFSNWTKKTHEL